MADLSVRDSKLVQYLNEAYGKEKERETALPAHIGMTTRSVYKKRLRQHLTETKRHARELERRVKQLGGTPQTGPIEGLDPLAKGAGAAVEIAGRAAAVAQGPLHAIRGTGEQEKMLKNAKSEYADEHEEIATTPLSRHSPKHSATPRRPSSRARSAARSRAWLASSSARSQRSPKPSCKPRSRAPSAAASAKQARAPGRPARADAKQNGLPPDAERHST